MVALMATTLGSTVVTLRDANGDEFHIHLGRIVSDEAKATTLGVRTLRRYVKLGAASAVFPVERVS